MRRPQPFTEATLAGPLSPVVLAIGAAVATGAVVLGIFAGPGTVTCIQRGDFGQCMSETFFGGQPVAVAETEPASEEAATVTELAEALESAVDTVAETAESVAAAVLPSFGLVRVEPDGSAVIAGTATPSGEVRIFINDQIIGSEIADSAGDWAFVTDTPLPPGGVELRVQDVESEQYASTSVVVVVQDDRTGQPLVVASEPGQASEILQGLTAPAAAPEAEVAEAAIEEPATAPAADAEPAAEVAVTDVAVADEQPAAEVALAEEPAVAETEPAATEVAATGADEPAAADEPLVVAQGAGPAVEQQPAPATATPDVPDVAEVAEAAAEAAEATEERIETAVSTQPSAPVVETPAPAITPSIAASIDAVEIDGDRNFFAGAGTDGLAVRLYVDNRAVGVAAVRGGRWLVEAINVLSRSTQRVRVDMIDNQGNVVSRAEVDFVVDVPSTEAPMVAEATEPEVVPEAPLEVAQAAEPIAAAPAGEPAAPPAPAATDAAPAPATSAQPATEPAPAPVVQQDEPPAAASGGEAAPVDATESEAPAGTPAPVTAPLVETPAAPAPSVPTLVGIADGDRVVSGQVIIRRGDNLWTIARRVYGEGMRYTQIYDANNDQIRDPNLIYPGQIFALPETDVVIGGED